MASLRLLAMKQMSPFSWGRNSAYGLCTSNVLCNPDDKGNTFEPLPVAIKEALIQEEQRTSNKITIKYPEDVSVMTAVPDEHKFERLVRISKATKSAMQSGTDNTHVWLMQFETRQRWENPLIGWCSNGDPLSNLQIRFNTKEEAMLFCSKNSWPYYIEKEKPMELRKKSYAVNFSWNKRTRVSTK